MNDCHLLLPIHARFCRGVNCNRCGETAYLSLTSPAIAKLHSTWVDDSILAMQRPSDTLMRDSNLIEQFVSNRIVAVFNLTEPGEHPYCGGGNLKESGFPYYPEKLMAAGSKCLLSSSTIEKHLDINYTYSGPSFIFQLSTSTTHGRT